MARALKDGEKVVGRWVHYVSAAGKIRPAVITALGAGDLVDLRMSHQVGDTVSGKDLMALRTDTDVWYAGSRRRYD